MKKITILLLLLLPFCFSVFLACTKYDTGFISPNITYGIRGFTVLRGRITSSYALTTDGSSTPIHVTMLHVYDSVTNKLMDSLFFKKYLTVVWTAVYNARQDTTYSLIKAKLGMDSMMPIVINETSGAFSSTPASIHLPLGVYLFDIVVSNQIGTKTLNKIMKVAIKDGMPLETTETYTGGLGGSFSVSAGRKGGSEFPILFSNTNYNPFVDYTVTRFADTPNILLLKVADRNNRPFNPKTGEIAKRLNTGLNPTPPYLPNLQYYSPDTYQESDTAIAVKYGFVPFPYGSLGSGYNMFYVVRSSAVIIDSTKIWTANPAPGLFYKGVTDSAYRGVYALDKYDYSIRVPMRIFKYGAYQINVKLLNTTHR